MLYIHLNILTSFKSGVCPKSFIERVERLEVDKAQVQEYIKDVFSEAKASGFDPKIMRQIIRMRKQDAEKLAEEEAILDLYKSALGMEI